MLNLHPCSERTVVTGELSTFEKTEWGNFSFHGRSVGFRPHLS